MARPQVRARRHRRLPAAGRPGSRRSSREQAARATREADLVLLVVDAAAGITEEDAAPRATPAPSDRSRCWSSRTRSTTTAEEAEVAAFHRLGLGEPVAVSALHGRGDRRPARPHRGAPARRVRSAEDGRRRAAVRDRRAPERRQVQPVQPAGREERSVVLEGRAPRATRSTRSSSGRTRARAIRRHRRDAPRTRRCAASSTTASCAHRGDRARRRRGAGARRGRRVHRRGQADRRPRDGRPAGRCSSSRTSGTSWRSKDRTFKQLCEDACSRSRTRRSMRTSAVTRPGRAPPAAAAARPPREVDRQSVDLAGERDRPDRTAASGRRRGARATCTTRRRSRPARPPFVIFGGAQRPGRRATSASSRTAFAGSFGLEGVPIRLRFRPQDSGLGQAPRRDRSATGASGYTARGHGPWRSLVSASDWGSEGRRFESGRPDGWTRAREAGSRVRDRPGPHRSRT